MGVVFYALPFSSRLNETEGVLLSNEAPPTDDDDIIDGNIDSLHPTIVNGMNIDYSKCEMLLRLSGAKLHVEVVTKLSPEGRFWCQLLFPSSEAEEGVAGGGAYTRLQEDLWESLTRDEEEAFTPVFYHEGQVCAARFSEDGEWYRARIETVTTGTVWNPDSPITSLHHLIVTASHVVHCTIFGLWQF